DIGAMTPFFYCFREREAILNMFEQVCGARLTPAYIRIGGVAIDLPVGFEETLAQFLEIFPDRIQEYEDLLQQNEIWIDRTAEVAVLPKETLIAYGVTGPVLRAAGVPYDVRKAIPYCGYEKYDFDIPLGEKSDVFDRYRVRMME